MAMKQKYINNTHLHVIYTFSFCVNQNNLFTQTTNSFRARPNWQGSIFLANYVNILFVFTYDVWTGRRKLTQSHMSLYRKMSLYLFYRKNKTSVEGLWTALDLR
jgi:hypothetical protein